MSYLVFTVFRGKDKDGKDMFRRVLINLSTIIAIEENRDGTAIVTVSYTEKTFNTVESFQDIIDKL